MISHGITMRVVNGGGVSRNYGMGVQMRKNKKKTKYNT